MLVTGAVTGAQEVWVEGGELTTCPADVSLSFTPTCKSTGGL